MLRFSSCRGAAPLFVAAAVFLSSFAAGAEEPIVNSIGMKLVPIPAGSFTMGQDGPATDYKFLKHPERCDDADWDEKPAHQVTITAPFHMAATEVTLGQYRKLFPTLRAGKGDDDEALRGVSWHEAVDFCKRLSKKEGRTYRLPTEAEWEYACRAGTTTVFHTGDKLPDGSHAWIGNTGFLERYFPNLDKLPAECRLEKPGAKLTVGRGPANAWGLHDMHGNVAEWCHDWYGPYEAGAQTDPVGRAEGDFRVFRGGHHTTWARLLRSANRGAWIPEAVNEQLGFRVVLGELPKTPPLAKPAAELNARDVAQILPKLKATSDTVPYFAGPRPFVKIAPESYGPLFSWHNHSPGICECPNGDLLAVWYSCSEEPGSELNNVASRLRPGSNEWEPASVFWDGVDVNDHGPKIWWDGDRTIYHFARGWTENIVRKSTDNGATWSKAEKLFPVGEFGNEVLRTKAGHLILTLDAQSASLVISPDGGKTWTYTDAKAGASDYRDGGRGFRHSGIHAPVVELADGRLMAFSRDNDEAQQAKYGGRAPFCFTSDEGKTWTYEASPFPAISSVQRPVMIRLREGPILLCTFTDQRRDWDKRQGMKFKDSAGGEFSGYGMFATLSFDDGKTWPVRRLITPGGPERTINSIDRSQVPQSDTITESAAYLACCQTRDGNIQLITSKNHYTFNLAWLKSLPEPVKK
jgi:formylglycine-generating enzyme required for sulfatase activity